MGHVKARDMLASAEDDTQFQRKCDAAAENAVPVEITDVRGPNAKFVNGIFNPAPFKRWFGPS